MGVSRFDVDSRSNRHYRKCSSHRVALLTEKPRSSLLSVLIVGLAIADLCFCCHHLLQEVILVTPIFGRGFQKTFTYTSKDAKLCISSTFLGAASYSAIMLTAVAIALYTFFAFHHHGCAKKFISSFVFSSWLACLVAAAVGTWKLRKDRVDFVNSHMELGELSFVAIFGCLKYSPHRHVHVYITIVLITVNAVSSLLVTVLYTFVWIKLRKTTFSSSHSEQEITRLWIRLTVISVLSVICWWPVYIAYWLTADKEESMYDTTVFPAVWEPVLISTAAVSAANPIIYTLASKRFCMVARLICKRCGFCRRKSVELLVVLPGAQETSRQRDRRCCGLSCHLLPCHRKKGVLILNIETLTEETDDTSLFTESQ